VAESNREIMERAYEHFEAGGGLTPGLAGPGFVWDMTNFAGWPEQPRYEGAGGAERFLADWAAAFDDWRIELESLYEQGEMVVAVLRQHGRAKSTGLTVEMTFAQLWTMRDGQYLRMEMYSDTAEALAAAGVRP
jgi:ketosteroid isomerase-like protein